MQPSADYPLFAVIALLGLMAFLACVDGYRAHLKADDALYAAYRAHRRLDRMQKSAKPTDRETMAVSYSQGFQVRDSWEDDFHRTQSINKRLMPSWRHKVVRWILY